MKFLVSLSLILLLSFDLRAQYVYQQLNNSDGLSNSTINRMFRDSDNMMWIATLDGLNVYDGLTFHVFNYQNVNSKNGIASNIIYQISEDKKRNIWLATAEGVTKYNKASGKFNNYYLNKSRVTTNGYFLGVDSLGTVYSARINTGDISYYDEQSDSFKKCEVEGLEEARITKMAIDKQGRLWIFKNNSLEVYARKGTSFYQLKGFPVIRNVDNLLFTNYTIFYSTTKKELFQVSPNLKIEKRLDLPARVRSMTSYQDRYIFAWSTKGIGEYDFNFKPAPLVSKSIPFLNTVKINNLITGKNQILWCGTDGNGIIKVVKKQNYFETILANQLPLNMQVNAFCSVDDETWIGTKGNGIMVAEIKDQAASVISNIQDRYQGFNLSDNSIYSIKKSPDKLVFIGSDAPGITVYDRQNRKFINWNHIKGSEKYPSFNSVHAILFDTDSSVWLGTYSSGLIHLKLKRSKYDSLQIDYLENYRYTNSSKGPGNDVINALERGGDGKIWIACRFGGLSIFDKKTKQFNTYKSSVNEGSLSNNDVLSLYRDQKGDMWIGTSFGLNVISDRLSATETPKFEKYGIENGLPNNTIHAINEDDKGDVWISTNKGLAKIDPENSTVIQFKEQDGLQGNEFSDNAIWKSENYKLYFGGLHGVNYFTPGVITVSNNRSNLVISDLKLAGKVVNESVLNIVNIDKWTDTSALRYSLNRQDNFFELRLNTIQYTDQEKCQYAYFLEGNDKTWHYVGDDRRISYSNLQPGNYTLKLKWSNGSGIWNKETAVFHLQIQQYFWLTWPAFVLYFALFGIAAYLFHLYRKNKLSGEHKLALESALRKKDEEVYKKQLHYFTNIAHELQTPLTIISGTLERYFLKSKKQGEKDKNKDLLYIVNDQSSRLNYLVYQLLEFRKAEEGHLQNRYTYLNASNLLNNVSALFAPLADQKNIDSSCYIEDDIKLWTDKDKLEKIIFNLLSNAYKHAGDKQQIICSLNKSPQQTLELVVANSGCSLTDAELEHLFTKFFVLDSSQQTKISTGLGLAFTKQLITFLQGDIQVKCKNNWIYFTVNLPLNYIPQESEKLDEKHEKPETPSYLISSISNENITAYQTSGENNKQAVLNRIEHEDRRSILVIEDEPAIRFLLHDILKEQYIVYEAANGRDALEIINKVLPDLIVSDIMMPDMTGLEICNRVKNLPHTCHIPFLVLSAKGTIDQQIEGYEAGADAYLSKPFHIEHLLVRIKRLLDYHKELHDFFKQDKIMPTVSTSGMKTDDKTFLEKTIMLIENNVETEELDAAFLEKELAMSKAYFYRRLKMLSGMTPSELIRRIRLQHAAALLQNSNLTVSEVFYRSGFNNQSYFFREFKKQYQISPSDYRAQFKVV